MLLSQKKSTANWITLVTIIGIGLFVSFLPLLIGGVFDANDLVSFHLKNAARFTEQFFSGDLYPRWLIDMNGGLGSPLFFFHAPLSYYVTSFFSLVFRDAKGWLPLVFSSSTALILSGFTAFLWLKEITNRSVALFGTIIYMILPYHLAIDLYWRFSITEMWVFVWLPLLLYFTAKIVQNERFSIVGYSFSLAALIFTQLSAALIFIIIPIGYGIALANRSWRSLIIRLLAATGLGICISSVYWYPADTMQNNIALKIDKIFFYYNNFLFKVPNEILDPTLWKYVEVISILTAVVAGCAWGIARYNLIQEYVMESYYWLGVTIVAVVMCTPLSQPIWFLLPPVQSVHLPWLFNILLVVSTTALISLAIYTIGNPISILIDKPIKIIVFVLAIVFLAGLEILPIYANNNPIAKISSNTVLIIVLSLLVAVGVSLIRAVIDFSHHRTLVVGVLLLVSLQLTTVVVIPEKLSQKPRNVTQELSVSIDSPRYRLRWVPAKLFNIGYLKSYVKNPNRAKFIAGEGTVKTTTWKPRNIILAVDAKKDSIIKVNQYYYPGWSASITGDKEVKMLLTKQSENDGLIQFNVPTGKAEVKLNLEASFAEKIGQIVTLVSSLGVIAWSAFSYYTKPYASAAPISDSNQEKSE